MPGLKSIIGKKPALAYLVPIVLLGLAVYANSWQGAFIWDDAALVQHNPHIRSWKYLPNIFVEDIASASGINRANAYRPLQMVTYMVDFSLWRMNPFFGFHLTNTLLHILAALSVFVVMDMLFSDRSLAFLTSLLFVVFPAHTEAVAYIAGRAEVLAALFMLLCLIFYIRAGATGKKSMLAPAFLAYVLALLSKEYALVLPFLLLCYGHVFRKKIDRSCVLALFAVGLLFVLWRAHVLRAALAPATVAEISMRLPSFFVAFAKYLKILLVPLGLHMAHGPARFGWNEPLVLTGAVALCLLCATALYGKEKRGLVYFSILWFLITLLPSANLFYPLNAYMAEHWLYLPSIGYLALVSYGLLSLSRMPRGRPLAFLLIPGILFFYSCATIKQNGYWKDPETFYLRTLQYAPGNPDLLNLLGNAYAEKGEHQKAIGYYIEALKNNPLGSAVPGIYCNLGDAFYVVGDVGKALGFYRLALESNPRFLEAYIKTGAAYQKIGKAQDALESYAKALSADPRFLRAYVAMAQLRHNLGEMKEATALYEKALALDPGSSFIRTKLIILYLEAGQEDSALKHCSEDIQACRRLFRLLTSRK